MRIFHLVKKFIVFIPLSQPKSHGLDVLRMVENRKGFSGFVLLSSRCTVWLVSMEEEALRSIVLEDFVKSYREGSKVTIVQSGGNILCLFFEVVV
jgi:hypothetical protein